MSSHKYHNLSSIFLSNNSNGWKDIATIQSLITNKSPSEWNYLRWEYIIITFIGLFIIVLITYLNKKKKT